MKKLLKVLLCYALIPFLACLPGLALLLSDNYTPILFVVPILTAVIYFLFRKKIDMTFSAKTNGVITAFLLSCFTVMMVISSGNVEGVLMARYVRFIAPVLPIMLLCVLMGHKMLLYSTALLTYMVSFLICAILGKLSIKKIWIPLLLSTVCIIVSGLLYFNRPSVKYGGHGFEFMHGYSSTDFKDYMVYSKNSKLVTLEQSPSLIIEKEEDMPILDGAEACYPLYAAFAKAVYKDIDVIESNWLKEADNQRNNGKIVTFTNSVYGFTRLLQNKESPYYNGIDMFFGARPSASQLKIAKDKGFELEITPIGREAFVFFVEADNPVNNLTSEQIKAIYHGDITNWSELGGKNQEILAFQRPHNSGSQTMMEYFMGDISLKDPQTYEVVSAMGGVIQEVAQYANENGAIGYSFRYFLEELNQEKGVKMLSVNGVYPSLDNISDGTYPLVVNVCLITRKDCTNPYVQKMIDFILSEEGQTIVKETGYAGIQ